MSSSTIVVVNSLKNSKVFDFFVARKFELHPLSEIWTAHYFRQRSFPKEPEQKWHLQKVLFLVLREKGEFDIKLSNTVFRIAQALVSNVDLRCEVQTNFLTRFCEKTFFPQKLMLCSIVRLRLNCFWKLFMSSYRLVHHMFSWIGKSKIIFSMRLCRRTTYVQKLIDACMFSNVVNVHGHEIFLSKCQE